MKNKNYVICLIAIFSFLSCKKENRMEPVNEDEKLTLHDKQTSWWGSSSQIEYVLYGLVCEKYGVELEQVKKETNFSSDLDGDWLDHIELIMDVEDEFEIEIPDEEVEKLTTVGELLNYLLEHVEPADSAECKRQFEEAKSEIASSYSVSEQLDDNLDSYSATTAKSTPRWIFHKGLGEFWVWESKENAQYEKINGTWKYKSLDHKSESYRGIMAGGRMQCVIDEEAPTVWPYNASMKLVYHFILTPGCYGVELPDYTSLDYTASAVFSIPSAVLNK